MSASGLHSILFGGGVVIVFVLLGSPCVDGRPQLLFEPSLESAASPAYLQPPPRPTPPPSPPSIHQAPGPLFSTLANQGTFPDFDNDDLPYLHEDMDGPQDKWEQVPGAEEFDLPPTLRWPERTLSSPRGKGGVHGTRPRSDFYTDERKENADALDLAIKDRGSSITSDSFDRLHRIVDKGVQSPEPTVVDADERRLSRFSRLPFPDDVPADHNQVLPWQKMLESDVDVDKVIRHDSSPLQIQPMSLIKADAQWKKLAQEEGRTVDTELVHSNDRAVTKENPFDDDEEDSDEVPQELVRKVVEAMDRPVSALWGHGAPDGPEDEEDVWTEGSGNGKNEEEDDGYVDWVIQKRAKTHNSRLIALIFQTVDDDQEEDEDDSAAAFDKELSIWQVLTNFPFPMLLHQGDSEALHTDYIYDDDDYDDDYDDDDYYDEFYSDEYYDYDEEDYSNYDNDDDNGRDDAPNESDEDLDDYFYSELYDDCDDCDEEGEGETAKQKALSLPPMFTR